MHPWLTALAGGLLIGAAAVLLYAAVGRIAGVSNIAYGGVWTTDGGRGLALLLGAPMPVASAVPWLLPLVSGVLVGIGTRLGNGCTSGHGVCGLGRLSPRSLAAVVVFMGLGMITATLLRPVML
jgi:uncharacterized membrane protein YedE/YeeE